MRAAWLAANTPISPDFIEVKLPRRERRPPGKEGCGPAEEWKEKDQGRLVTAERCHAGWNHLYFVFFACLLLQERHC